MVPLVGILEYEGLNFGLMETEGYSERKNEVLNLQKQKIYELQGILTAQAVESATWERAATDLKKKYKMILGRNVTLEKEVELLKQTVQDYEQQTEKSEKWTAELQEVDACKDTVDSLKESVSFLKTLLKEKSEVSACIQADYEVLQNDLEISREQYNSLMAKANQKEADLKLEIKDLRGKLERSEHNYHKTVEDNKKYQNLLSQAANQEVRLQKEFTEQLEMDETIQNLQDNMNKMNLNLLTTVKRLEDKEKLMQNLQSEVGKLRRQLESEDQKATSCEEVYTLQKEALHLKSEIRRLMLLQERTNAEVREYLSVPEVWWWDDFWQI